MVASTKLLHLLEAFSTPWFLFSSPTNHHLVFFLLEIFNNIIQYQFDGKCVGNHVKWFSIHGLSLSILSTIYLEWGKIIILKFSVQDISFLILRLRQTKSRLWCNVSTPRNSKYKKNTPRNNKKGATKILLQQN